MQRKPGFECGQLLAVESADKCRGNGSPNPNHAVLHVASSKIIDQHFSMWPGELPAPGRTWRKCRKSIMDSIHSSQITSKYPLQPGPLGRAEEQPGCPTHSLLSTLQLLPW